MKIREMKPGEDNEIIRVIQDAFQAPPWNLVMPMSEITPRLEMFVNEGRHTLVAEKNDELAGLIWFGTIQPGTVPEDITDFISKKAESLPQIYIGAVAVRHSWQSQGIGNTLMQKALEFIRIHYPSCVMYSRMRSDNPRVIAIHESFGFSRSGIYEEHYGVSDEWWFSLQK